MRSAAAAFAWEFGRRLRWGLALLGGYLLVLGLAWWGVLGRPIHFRYSVLFAFTVTVPMTAAFFYLLAVFSYGLAGDLTARRSMYPARMFTLPVTTAALAGYPMLYGSVAVATLYMVANVIAVRPLGLHLPMVWPALFVAVFLAWTQAFTWMPYGLPGLRAIVAVLSLITVDAVVFLAIELKVSEPLMIAVLAPQIPLAYVAARYAVGRARRGEVPDWGTPFARGARMAGSARRARGQFLSPRRAQSWFEWRQHGWSLPGWLALVLPFEVALLYVARDEPRVLTALTLAGMLLTPPFLAAFVAATVSRSGAASAHGLAPFLATRPLSTPALVAAKLAMALASTLAAWVLVLVAVPLGITASGAWPLVAARFDAVAAFVGRPRTITFVLIVFAGLVVATWKQLVQGLAIGLTGREGLVKSSVLLRLCSLILLGPLLDLVATDGDVRAALWDGVPWILAALAGLKMGAAAWTATRLLRARLLSGRAVVAGALSWLAAVLGLYGVLAWLLDTPHVAHSLLLLVAVLAVPVVRPAAAALALAWNRHQGSSPPSTMTVAGATRAIPAALVLFALPLALAAVEAVSFRTHNRNNGAIVSSGVEREYLVHVPKSYDPSRPTPLVISMHGAGMWPAAQRDASRWNEVADEHGFIVVYPAGFSHGSPRVWRMGSGPGGRAEVQFLADLIDRLRATYTIDPRRIYADGLSNGGGMAFVLSCTLSDRIAAVGMVGSAQLLPWSWCTDGRPVPMVNFHGTADQFAPYHGGKSFVVPRPLPDVPVWTANWARRNRCAGKAVESRVAADVTRLEYTGCADDATVVLYTVHGGGHTWPGGGPMPEWFAGPTSHGIDASREAWAFFRAHPLRARPR